MMGERRKSPVEIEIVPPYLCTIDLRLDSLSRVPFLGSLAPAAVARVNQRFQARSFDAGETLYLSGEPATYLYVVASGQVRLLQHSLSGKDVLLDLLTPGSISAP